MAVKWSDGVLAAVFAKTRGHCTYCVTRIELDLAGRCGELHAPVGAWEVDRWMPPDRCVSPAEADSLANLVPACCRCKREKGPASGDEYVAVLRRRAGLA